MARQFTKQQIEALAEKMEHPPPVPVFKSVTLLADSDLVVGGISDMRLIIHYHGHELCYRVLCTGIKGNEKTLTLFPFEEPPLDSYEIN